jgi:hypothetical protein
MDSKETDVSSKTIENVDEDKQVSILDSPLKYVEISPNKQYIRFEEIISKTKTIKTSYKAFDTLKGIEVSWHTINLIGLSDEEQIRIIESCNYLKDLQCKNVMEYLHSWTVPETKIMNIITTRLDSLREYVISICYSFFFLHNSTLSLHFNSQIYWKSENFEVANC